MSPSEIAPANQFSRNNMSWPTYREKLSSYMFLGALVQKLIFRDGASGLFGFGRLSENLFKRSIEVKSIVKP